MGDSVYRECLSVLFTAFGKKTDDNQQLEEYIKFLENSDITHNLLIDGIEKSIQRLKFLPSIAELIQLSIEIPIGDKTAFLDKFRALSYYRDNEMPDDVYTVYIETLNDRSDESVIRAYSKLKHGILKMKQAQKSLAKATFYQTTIKKEDRAIKIKELLKDGAVSLGRRI